MSLPLRDRSRGQALVEFAVVVPVFVLLLLGITDLGRAVYAYHTLNNAAREGARQAIVDQYEAHIKDVAATQAVGVGATAADVYVDYRAPSTPEVENSCDANVGADAVVGCIAVVRVTYDYTAATPVIGNIVGTVEMAGESRFPVGFNCGNAACPLGE